MDFPTWLREQGFELQQLNEKQTASMKRLFELEQRSSRGANPPPGKKASRGLPGGIRVSKIVPPGAT
jgi:hypothetical protein